ncbi:AAA family ATPase [Amycolatopsis sp. Poz14]|uniref:AAA family ATPase n=1 Tax=Amycolatopsis sp. Poz14 TaxID=1447705 RepID=UPI001EE84C11|nr:AAA family ATPase [Amycolatopsis sp. Poz14]MCG3749430.1 AAA family ATPase [Amycolatopsis sp. Poz14]
MARHSLSAITIEGFTSIRSARVPLGSMNVLVGANGTGKSNFIQALGLLSSVVDGDLGLYVGLHGGAAEMGYKGSALSSIGLALDLSPAKYRIRLVPAANDELIFDLEEISSATPESQYRRELGQGHRESRLEQAIDEHDEAAELIHTVLKGCRVYHFDDTSRDAPVKRQAPTADNLALRDDAANLAPVLLRLRRSDRPEDKAAYRRITSTVRLVAPFFKDFVLDDEYGTDRVRLRWIHKDLDGVFSAEQMSDGTLRFVCLATLLMQPQLPGLVVLDEPELGLHPYAIVVLADMLRRAAAHSQVLIATQSVTLMNQFTVDDLIVVEQHDGSSSFGKPNPDALRTWLEDYSLGELWEKNLIGGQPGSRGSVLND